ncbi:MAG: CAAX protease [Candidatus Eremiobacteraeota bacterium]|nr:CAAX protease [Candidatus Eremiobacteraeota bacterium]MBC5820650.1 CAAX protease [Candidatus Eremiobacteraeota bacterium]
MVTVAPNALTTLGGVLRLQPGAFVHELGAENSVSTALVIVLIAGFSEAVGQSVVLFANRVKPVRFVFTIAIQSLLSAFGFVFLVLSTWAITALTHRTHVPIGRMALAFALSYVPLWFAFLTGLPYLGSPLLLLLRVWHLLALIVGFAAVSGISEARAPLYVGLGWLVLVTTQHTLGRPIASFGARLLKSAAGVDLRDYEVQFDTGRFTATNGSNAASGVGSVMVRPQRERGRLPWGSVLGAAIVLVLGLIVALALAPLRHSLFGSFEHVPALVRIPFALLWVGVVALVVAALLAPLETLGWWAGWYGGELDTTRAGPEPTDGRSAGDDVERYVVYLDGIAQSSAQYTPETETFLDTLGRELPKNMRLIRGVMSYSVLNRPLDDDPLFSALWRFIAKVRLRNTRSLLGMVINVRNVLVVAVSADQRYGPMYNFGIAQILYNVLVQNGYRPKCGVPVTLIGYSGGGQMAAASAPVLKRAIDAPIDVISLGGVISGACKLSRLEQLYHHAGSKDGVQRLGPIMFPTRWKIAVLSNWNRALRLGRISFIALGPVGHQVPGGIFDPNARLSDGRTFLRQTLDCVADILNGRITAVTNGPPVKISNYERYVQAPWNRPDYYPISAGVDPTRYVPIGEWMGRLILPRPEEREDVRGAWFEVHHADAAHRNLIGTTVKLRWSDDPVLQAMVRAVTRDVHFSPKAQYTSRYSGYVHPTRLNHWKLVDPLESLAGSHPFDDIIVMLIGGVEIDVEAGGVVARIARQPVQISGRYYGLVRFDEPVADDRYRVTHFNRETHDFSGPIETVRVPRVVADSGGRPPWSPVALEDAEPNADGWYVYGAPDAEGTFVVVSLAPRALLRALPARTLHGAKTARRYVRAAWHDVVRRKGTIDSTQLANDGHGDGAPRADWKEGDEALLVHIYGGIGGRAREAAARARIYFGHFAYGIAEVFREPLGDELSFTIVYHQVYTNNTDGLIPGALHWSRYMGDRQFGWAGLRPVCDTLLISEAFCRRRSDDGASPRSALCALRTQLEAMTARYRTGDGTGGTYVGGANNCAQDSNRALFATLQSLGYLDQRRKGDALGRLAADLRRQLQPFGTPRRDWSDNEFNLGTTIEDDPLRSLCNAFGSWRVMLPRVAGDTIVGTFLRHGSSARVLFADQIGGRQDDIEPIAPTTLPSWPW